MTITFFFELKLFDQELIVKAGRKRKHVHL